MKTVFFTLMEDHYANVVEHNLFVSSFKRFHPDIDLVTLGSKEIQEIKNKNPWASLYNMKATAAKLFCDQYDLVVNIDADHFIFDRMEEILKGDYDVACPSNYNNHENMSLSIFHEKREWGSEPYKIISEKKYLQGGLIASTNRNFWHAYEYASKKHALQLMCKENDILNLMLEFHPFRFKLLDGGYDLDCAERTCFYGCSSLNLEKEIIISNNKPTLKGKVVKAYHVARGGIVKPKFKELFNQDVVNWFHEELNVSE